jgi:hypothetical protein
MLTDAPDAPTTGETFSSVLEFIVVYSPWLFVRPLPSRRMPHIGKRYFGDVVRCIGIQNGWLQMEAGGWMMRDGTALGLGVLLVPRPLEDISAQILASQGFIWQMPQPSLEEQRLAIAATAPLVVCVRAGLCNRIRVVCSYLDVARRSGRMLIVWWPINEHCPGRFTDAFILPPAWPVEFVEDEPMYAHMVDTERVHDWHPEVQSFEARAACFAELEPSPAVAQRVSVLTTSCGPFIACHVRRTDHWDQAWNTEPTTDEEFDEFCLSFPGRKIFLAADEAATQLRFREHHGQRLHMSTQHFQQGALRHTSIEDAAVDLFTCCAAEVFKGTRASSFSDTIVMVRAQRGVLHSFDEHECVEPQRLRALGMRAELQEALKLKETQTEMAHAIDQSSGTGSLRLYLRPPHSSIHGHAAPDKCDECHPLLPEALSDQPAITAYRYDTGDG